MRIAVQYESGMWYGQYDLPVYKVEISTREDSVHIEFTKPPEEDTHFEPRRGTLELPLEVARKMALAILAQTTGPPGEPISFGYDERE